MVTTPGISAQRGAYAPRAVGRALTISPPARQRHLALCARDIDGLGDTSLTVIRLRQRSE